MFGKSLVAAAISAACYLAVVPAAHAETDLKTHAKVLELQGEWIKLDQRLRDLERTASGQAETQASQAGDLSSRLDALEAKVQASESNKETAELRKQVDVLRADVAKLNSAAASPQALQALSADVVETQRQVALAAAAAERAQATIGSVEETKTHLQALEARVDKMGQSQAEDPPQWRAAVAQVRGEFEALRDQVNVAVRTSVASATTDSTNIWTRLQQLEDKITDLATLPEVVTRLTATSASASQVERINDEVRSLQQGDQQAVARVAARVDALDRELEAVRKVASDQDVVSKAGLTQKLAEYDKALAQRGDAAAQAAERLASLTARAEAMEAELQRLQSRTVSAEQVEQLESGLAKVRKSLADVERAAADTRPIADVRRELATEAQRREQLGSKIDGIAASSLATSTQVTAAQERIRAEQERLATELGAVKEATSAAERSAGAERAGLQLKLARLESGTNERLEGYQVRIGDLENDLQQQAGAVAQQFAAIQSQLEAQVAQNQELLAQRDQAVAALKNQQSAIAAATAQLQQQIAALQVHVSSQERALIEVGKLNGWVVVGGSADAQSFVVVARFPSVVEARPHLEQLKAGGETSFFVERKRDVQLTFGQYASAADAIQRAAELRRRFQINAVAQAM